MAALLLMAGVASAVPVRPGQWSTLTLADGTTVRAELRGSEYGTWFQDAQGQCYVKQGDRYVRAEEASSSTSRQTATAVRRSHRGLFTSTGNGLGSKGKNSGGAMYSLGEHTIPVLMVEFSDTKFSPLHTPAFVQEYLTKEGFQYANPNTGMIEGLGSIRDFFVSQSQGQFKPTFNVLGKVTVDNPYRYYGQHGVNPNYPNEGQQPDMRPDQMVFDAMKAAMTQLQGVDFKAFEVETPADENHAKGIPLLCCLYAGEAESNHGNPEDYDYQPDLLWPHELDVNKDVEVAAGTTVHLNSYFIGHEIENDGKSLAGVGIFVHELGHALGLPDWYCTTTDPSKAYSGDDAYGFWSTMDVGCYVGGGWTPMGYTAYERSYMGWLDIPTITTSGHVKLNKPYTDGYCAAFFINGDKEKDPEYFIVETRYPSTWYPEATRLDINSDVVSYGSGLMLTRFAFDPEIWNLNAPNNLQKAKRSQMITADGEYLNRFAHQSNLYGNGVSTISGKTFLSGKKWDATLSNIKKNEDGSVEFDLDLGGSTGIGNLTTDRSQEAGSYYDLQGRRVAQPTKGLYIHNGKKVVIQ